MKNNKRGFTLMEIVMVLVLLGVLAAVALPKYYNLKESAEAQTAKAVAAEYQARLNAEFASAILNDAKNDCDTSVTAAIKAADDLFKATTDDAKFHGFTLVTKNVDDQAKGKITITLKKSKQFEPITIVVPVCPKTTTPSTGTGD